MDDLLKANWNFFCKENKVICEKKDKSEENFICKLSELKNGGQFFREL